MKTQIGVMLLSIASGLVVWVLTTAVSDLDLLWRLLVAAAAAIVTASIGLVVMGRKGDPGRTRVASNISGQNIRISDIKVNTRHEAPAWTVASDLKAPGDVDISHIEGESK